MTEDELMNRLASAPERVWHVPENADITPGTGSNIWAGLVIVAWGDQ
ncbi:hypothetical protein [Mycolicibacterium parafortuitum]|uniref:Uncharacterized protein n=1 Tax=Mycolicibacterium parafortuitum TaxID=39692 RepID=A0A375Z5L6_MYCPF|nr:hypothetical protein [Mycolicibacterium parafortuitum]SSA20674.1 hypothetical protein MPP7335_05828 [Mycolicibacterium parafortuitum]